MIQPTGAPASDSYQGQMGITPELAKGAIDITKSVTENLHRVAEAEVAGGAADAGGEEAASLLGQDLPGSLIHDDAPLGAKGEGNPVLAAGEALLAGKE